MNGPSFALPRTPSLHPAMAEALALVRRGELQAASTLLRAGLQGGAEHVPPEPRTTVQPSASAVRTAARRFAHTDVTDAEDLRAPPRGDAPVSEGPERAGRFAPEAFVHGGLSHPFHLYVPASAAPPEGRALIVMLHGCTQDAQDFARGTRMNAAAESVGALVLYPTQPRAANQNGCWNWFRPEDQRAGGGEPALLLAMVRHVAAQEHVDPRRVYVAGLSAGGAMAALLAREYPQVFAAAGVHSGLVAGAAQNVMGALSAMKSGAKGWGAAGAQPAGAVPLIVFHGEADSTVHPRNGEQLLQRAGADLGARAQRRTEAGRSADGQRYTRTVLHDSAAPGTVWAEHWLLHGAGHAWSGGDARGSHTSARGVDASREMLRFFMEHPQTARGQRAA